MRVSSVVSSQPIKNNSKFGVNKEYKQYLKLNDEADRKVGEWREAGLLALVGAAYFDNHKRTFNIKKMKCGDWAFAGCIVTSALCMITACIKKAKVYNELKQQQNAN